MSNVEYERKKLLQLASEKFIQGYVVDIIWDASVFEWLFTYNECGMELCCYIGTDEQAEQYFEQ